MNDLKQAIVKSVEESVDAISSVYPGDDFYAVVVSTDTDLESLMISANSYQNLKRLKSEHSLISRLVDSKNYLKWVREEWASFDGFSNIGKVRTAWEHSYEIKNKLISDAYNVPCKGSKFSDFSFLSDHNNDPAIIYRNAEYLLSVMCDALKNIGNATWEKLNSRDELLVFCTFEPDSEEAVRWNSAKYLNDGIVNSKLLREFRKVCKS